MMFIESGLVCSIQPFPLSRTLQNVRSARTAPLRWLYTVGVNLEYITAQSDTEAGVSLGRGECMKSHVDERNETLAVAQRMTGQGPESGLRCKTGKDGIVRNNAGIECQKQTMLSMLSGTQRGLPGEESLVSNPQPRMQVNQHHPVNLAFCYLRARTQPGVRYESPRSRLIRPLKPWLVIDFRRRCSLKRRKPVEWFEWLLCGAWVWTRPTYRLWNL
jgi:hypothetical protein